MKILYLLRKTPDSLIKEMIVEQGQENDITLVLIQEAAAGSVPAGLHGRVLAIEDSECSVAEGMGIKTIGFQDLLSLIFNNDRVLCI